ncbi:MAG: cytochrome c peroxidase [Alphaproteobacteria bacterium]|nr:cytochrome c peroxidase [Alphaproteobacteria bacterium]MDP6817174.1 cytochrome c peroxidase [Alphaproteobacteria bacterium]
MKTTAALLSALLMLLLAPAVAVSGEAYDQALRALLASHGQTPLESPPFVIDDKYLLGQALFFDPVLSGARQVACATCHLPTRGTSNGQALAVGVDGRWLGENRLTGGRGFETPRNSPDIWNRGHAAVQNMFWDGRVALDEEAIDDARRYDKDDTTIYFETPMAGRFPDGVENLLAAQALFPLTGVDEMLGRPGDRSPRDFADEHANLPNELAQAAAGTSGPRQIQIVHEALVARLLAPRLDTDDLDEDGEPELAEWQKEYRRLAHAAYPDVSLRQLSIVELVNAIGHFEKIAFATRNAPWDNYLRGDNYAISYGAKAGARIFFGNGRCAACHSGPLFSDYEFHSLGVRQIGPGKNISSDDLGRYHVTGDKRDLYKFRTPPLRNVTLSAPYFHDDVAATLRAAIRHHNDPLNLADAKYANGTHSWNRGKRKSVSYVLAAGLNLTDTEINRLIAFLKSLEDDVDDLMPRIVPARVPSGLPVASMYGLR